MRLSSPREPGTATLGIRIEMNDYEEWILSCLRLNRVIRITISNYSRNLQQHQKGYIFFYMKKEGGTSEDLMALFLSLKFP